MTKRSQNIKNFHAYIYNAMYVLVLRLCVPYVHTRKTKKKTALQCSTKIVDRKLVSAELSNSSTVNYI